jgi:DNA-binding HxlR family transcriptional regulator
VRNPGNALEYGGVTRSTEVGGPETATDSVKWKHAEKSESAAASLVGPEGHDYSHAACEAARILSGKWVLAVLVELAEGPQRHNDLARAVGAEDHKPIDRALRRLLLTRMVERTVHDLDGSAPRVCYELTLRGHSALPVIQGLAGWWREAGAPEH